MQCTQLRRIELDRSFLIDCKCPRFAIDIVDFMKGIRLIVIIIVNIIIIIIIIVTI